MEHRPEPDDDARRTSEPGGGAGPGPGAASPGSGIAPNVAGALSYFLGALTGIAFLVIDRDRPFVRFHAMQSILLTLAAVALSVALMIVSVVLGALPLVGWIISVLLSLAISIGGFVLWVYLMYRAFQGDEWELPVIGPQARRFAAQV